MIEPNAGATATKLAVPSLPVLSYSLSCGAELLSPQKKTECPQGEADDLEARPLSECNIFTRHVCAIFVRR